MSADVAVATLVTVGDGDPVLHPAEYSPDKASLLPPLCHEPGFPLPSRHGGHAANRARDEIPGTLVASPKFASVPFASRAALVAGRH